MKKEQVAHQERGVVLRDNVKSSIVESSNDADNEPRLSATWNTDVSIEHLRQLTIGDDCNLGQREELSDLVRRLYLKCV